MNRDTLLLCSACTYSGKGQLYIFKEKPVLAGTMSRAEKDRAKAVLQGLGLNEDDHEHLRSEIIVGDPGVLYLLTSSTGRRLEKDVKYYLNKYRGKSPLVHGSSI